MLFVYASLAVFSLVDRDIVIAKVNFNRADKAFVHLNFMAELDDRALPYLDREVGIQNMEKSPAYQLIGRNSFFMSSEEYKKFIADRKSSFISNYPNRTFLEWNLADQRAYKKLTKK